jgi:AcrR family transcriptional regulator
MAPVLREYGVITPFDQWGGALVSDKPLRADARRNRAALLDAAEAVFAASGPAASTEEVARAAGVGIGTLFRHFPTKEALLEAVYLARLQRLGDQAVALAEADDPGAAFFDYFRTVVEESPAKTALTNALAEAGVDPRAAAAGLGFQAAFGRLLARAQRAGAVRADIGVADMVALLVGASHAVEHATDPAVRDRTIAIVIDGLRPRR